MHSAPYRSHFKTPDGDLLQSDLKKKFSRFTPINQNHATEAKNHKNLSNSVIKFDESEAHTCSYSLNRVDGTCKGHFKFFLIHLSKYFNRSFYRTKLGDSDNNYRRRLPSFSINWRGHFVTLWSHVWKIWTAIISANTNWLLLKNQSANRLNSLLIPV